MAQRLRHFVVTADAKLKGSKGRQGTRDRAALGRIVPPVVRNQRKAERADELFVAQRDQLAR